MSGKPLLCALLALSLPVLLGLACDPATHDPQEQPAALAPESNELPPLQLRDDTPDLLLTWVDDKGDFHVVQKPADVPAGSRKQVRVVVTNLKEGTGRLVYVADLSKKQADGTYAVKTMTRAQWDELGAARRQARLEALAPSAQRPAASASSAGAAKRTDSPARVVAIVYGAEWCKPCHDAARYLKRLGATVVEKNIDTDPLAKREMLSKLRKAQLPPSSSIPIIDVAGRVLVGFSPAAVSRALQAAREAQAL
jgi:glutaredoxin